jgi:hypothetical protein
VRYDLSSSDGIAVLQDAGCEAEWVKGKLQDEHTLEFLVMLLMVPLHLLHLHLDSPLYFPVCSFMSIVVSLTVYRRDETQRTGGSRMKWSNLQRRLLWEFLARSSPAEGMLLRAQSW